jgi:hypothetical protein
MNYNLKMIFKNTCLETPDYHRITSKGSFIVATQVHGSSNETVGLGFWVYDQNLNTEERTTMVEVPLYTRFQPQGCRSKPTNNTHCANATDRTGFDSYRFKWNNKTEEALLCDGNQEAPKICLIGFSHSRRLLRYMQRWLKRNDWSKHGKMDWHKVHFIDQFSEAFASNLFESDCTKILVGLGQWDAAGLGRRGPTQFDAYKDGMLRIMNQMKALNENRMDGKHIQVYFRSMHYNPIGDAIGRCSPDDWRSPPVIDGYNAILKQLCDEENIAFLNSNVVLGPMWDTASDWCIYNGK